MLIVLGHQTYTKKVITPIEILVIIKARPTAQGVASLPGD